MTARHSKVPTSDVLKVSVPFEETSFMNVVVDLYDESLKQPARLGFSQFREYFILALVMTILFTVLYSSLFFLCDNILCRKENGVF